MDWLKPISGLPCGLNVEVVLPVPLSPMIRMRLRSTWPRAFLPGEIVVLQLDQLSGLLRRDGLAGMRGRLGSDDEGVVGAARLGDRGDLVEASLARADHVGAELERERSQLVLGGIPVHPLGT